MTASIGEGREGLNLQLYTGVAQGEGCFAVVTCTIQSYGVKIKASPHDFALRQEAYFAILLLLPERAEPNTLDKMGAVFSQALEWLPGQRQSCDQKRDTAAILCDICDNYCARSPRDPQVDPLLDTLISQFDMMHEPAEWEAAIIDVLLQQFEQKSDAEALATGVRLFGAFRIALKRAASSWFNEKTAAFALAEKLLPRDCFTAVRLVHAHLKREGRLLLSAQDLQILSLLLTEPRLRLPHLIPLLSEPSFADYFAPFFEAYHQQTVDFLLTFLDNPTLEATCAVDVSTWQSHRENTFNFFGHLLITCQEKNKRLVYAMSLYLLVDLQVHGPHLSLDEITYEIWRLKWYIAGAEGVDRQMVLQMLDLCLIMQKRNLQQAPQLLENIRETFPGMSLWLQEMAGFLFKGETEEQFHARRCLYTACIQTAEAERKLMLLALTQGRQQQERIGASLCNFLFDCLFFKEVEVLPPFTAEECALLQLAMVQSIVDLESLLDKVETILNPNAELPSPFVEALLSALISRLHMDGEIFATNLCRLLTLLEYPHYGRNNFLNQMRERLTCLLGRDFILNELFDNSMALKAQPQQLMEHYFHPLGDKLDRLIRDIPGLPPPFRAQSLLKRVKAIASGYKFCRGCCEIVTEDKRKIAPRRLIGSRRVCVALSEHWVLQRSVRVMNWRGLRENLKIVKNELLEELQREIGEAKLRLDRDFSRRLTDIPGWSERREKWERYCADFHYISSVDLQINYHRLRGEKFLKKIPQMLPQVEKENLLQQLLTMLHRLQPIQAIYDRHLDEITDGLAPEIRMLLVEYLDYIKQLIDLEAQIILYESLSSRKRQTSLEKYREKVEQFLEQCQTLILLRNKIIYQ